MTTTQTKHTPGPWAVGELKRDGAHFSIEVMSPGRVNSCFCYAPSGSEMLRDRAIADAYLVGAAPDLLKAAKDFLQCANRPADDSPWIQPLIEAIAKAEGKMGPKVEHLGPVC